MKNHNILIKTYKNDLEKFLEIKFFRLYLRLLKCKNFNLNKYSKNYLNHLHNTNEMLSSMILTLNNINFYQELMYEIRKNIKMGTFEQFHDKYINIL